MSAEPSAELTKEIQREAFIPFSRQDLLELILQDSAFAERYGAMFKSFAQLLSASLHHTYHERLEALKTAFAHLDPDRDTVSYHEPDAAERKRRESELLSILTGILERANYCVLTPDQLQQAIEGRSLINLDLKIDFNDFEQMLFYWRGATTLPVPPPPKWQFWRKSGEMMDVFQRVVLLIRFRDSDYFEARGLNPEQLRFTPGKMYLYLYKLIPKLDLEVLFPNVEIHMTLKDRLLFVIPALGAAIPMVLKALPQLLLVVGVLLFLTLGPASVERLGLKGSQISNYLPVLVALLSLGLLFGGFAVKQYLGYKNKKLKFLKDVTDTLFFRNLVSNAGVFHALVDAGEEEETKEILLVVYQLLQAEQALTAENLDQRIETWLETKGVNVDFNVDKALKTMMQIQSGEQALLSQTSQTYQVLPLEQACQLLDEIWDGLYSH